MSDFLLAALGLLLIVGLIVWLEYRSRPRDTPKAAGLKAANRGPAALQDQLERERKERGLP